MMRRELTEAHSFAGMKKLMSNLRVRRFDAVGSKFSSAGGGLAGTKKSGLSSTHDRHHIAQSLRPVSLSPEALWSFMPHVCGTFPDAFGCPCARQSAASLSLQTWLPPITV